MFEKGSTAFATIITYKGSRKQPHLAHFEVFFELLVALGPFHEAYNSPSYEEICTWWAQDIFRIYRWLQNLFLVTALLVDCCCSLLLYNLLAETIKSNICGHYSHLNSNQQI